MNEGDPGRLRFVASHFESLQGLRGVPFGVYLLLAWVIKFLGWPTGCEVLTLALCTAASWWAKAYYERRLGHVETLGQSRRLMLFIGLTALCVYLDLTFHRNFFGWLLGAWFWIGFWGSSGRRWYYLLPGTLLVVLAAMLRQPYTGEYNWLFGASIVFVGILDHILLVRSLPGLHPVANHG